MKGILVVHHFREIGEVEGTNESLNGRGCRYSVDQQLNESDKSVLMMTLYFHPRRDEKIGIGAKDIKVCKYLGDLCKYSHDFIYQICQSFLKIIIN